MRLSGKPGPWQKLTGNVSPQQGMLKTCCTR
jgi:hypothetical protein